MRRLVYLLSILVFLPSYTQASSTSSLGSVACSGTETFSLIDIASLSCTGDLSLSGGTLNSDSRIEIHADGLLDLDNVQLRAPSIDLYAGGTLIIGANSTIGPTDQLTITANTFTLDGTLLVNNLIHFVINQEISSTNYLQINEPLPTIEVINSVPLLPLPFQLQAVPLPASFWLMLSGLMLLRKKFSMK